MRNHLLFLAPLILACATEAPEQVRPDAPHPDTLALTECRAELAELHAEIEACQEAAPAEQLPVAEEAEVLRLYQRVALLEEELAAAKAEISKYRKGLHAAVDELNAAAQEHSAAGETSHSAQPRPNATAPSAARVSAYSGPYTQLVGDSIIVTGKLWNSGDTGGDLRLIVSLVEGGAEVDSATLLLPASARTSTPYSHTFTYTPRDGTTYSARVRITQ